MRTHMTLLSILLSIGFFSCAKKSETSVPITPPKNLQVLQFTINDQSGAGPISKCMPLQATIKVVFDGIINKSSVSGAVQITNASGVNASIAVTTSNHDSSIVITPTNLYSGLTKYNILISKNLTSVAGGNLGVNYDATVVTGIDSTRKFPLISDNALLDTIQKRHFKYFWDFGHPISGLARERNTSGDIVTIGGSGFALMTLPIAISRNFITRADGLARATKMVDFLKNTAQKFHGVYPHWINGASGVVVPFSTKDNGADLVETSYLIAGLLTIRQYFNLAISEELTLRNNINAICNAVEWNWFRNGGQQVLYWHWSPNYNFEMNHQIRGWNECLITYVMAASSSTDSIPATVYHNGFATSPTMINNNQYFGVSLPLGPTNGGPLFFAHYSFLGINPFGLTDKYANYQTQVINHSKINYNYCIANPKNYLGYSNSCWGLTASDIPNGYAANDPNNDIGVISPTAALSSMPYTPVESMRALQFFYYTLGDKVFKEYGFSDAFSIQDLWFSNSSLAIDQGPIIIMIENYRSGLIWNLLTSCPEVKLGLQHLGFNAPYL